jgi:S1-C subfamily serine protease
VVRLYDNGPAARAGLKAGDVIVRVDGFDVADARSVQYRLTTRGIGSQARLEVVREGKPVSIELPLSAAPKPGRDDVRTLSGPHPFDGARVANLGPAIADELGLDEAAGVVIVSVQQGGGAANIGLRGGDLVLRLGRDDIASIADLERALKQRTRIWQVTLKRGERVLQFQVQG